MSWTSGSFTVSRMLVGAAPAYRPGAGERAGTEMQACSIFFLLGPDIEVDSLGRDRRTSSLLACSKFHRQAASSR